MNQISKSSNVRWKHQYPLIFQAYRSQKDQYCLQVSFGIPVDVTKTSSVKQLRSKTTFDKSYKIILLKHLAPKHSSELAEKHERRSAFYFYCPSSVLMSDVM